MKNLFVFIALIISTFAFAGPEDHMYDTCFTATTKAPSFVPSTFCFANANLDTQKNVLFVDGYASNVPSALPTTKLIRQTEDTYSFEATIVIANKWEICFDGEFAKLTISGVSDFNGTIDPKTLNFSVYFEETNDTCHLNPRDGVVDYKLSK